MRLKIDVTDEHIAKGKPGEQSACPIARAIMEQVPCVRCDVKDNCISLIPTEDFPGDWFVIRKLPNSDIRLFVNAFDHGDPVKPFSFHMTIADELLTPKEATS